MKRKNVLGIILVLSVCTFAKLSYAFELNPTEEQIHQAISTGAKHFMDIFESSTIKEARFGDWPKGDGGIVETKLIYLSIIASMRVRARMPEVSEDKIASVMNSKEMPVRISSSMNVFNVVLKQNGKSIEATRIEEAMQMPPSGGGGGDGHPQALKVYFNYDDVDPKAMSTIVLYEDFGEVEFKIDFSKFD